MEPSTEVSNTQGNSSLITTGPTNPVLYGSSVNFTCASGYELSGPTTATCMSDGNWEPDIGNVKCIELPGNILYQQSNKIILCHVCDLF